MSALTADPPAASFPVAGGASKHNLTNGGTDRLAFKIKSSNNNDYRIKPVFGFAEPGQAAVLEVTRIGGAPKEDKLVVHFAVVPADATDPKTAFEAAQATAQQLTIAMSAA